MKEEVTYDGPYREGVDISLPDGRAEHVAHGASIEVDAETAESLIQQGTWKKHKPVAHHKKESK